MISLETERALEKLGIEPRYLELASGKKIDDGYRLDQLLVEIEGEKWSWYLTRDIFDVATCAIWPKNKPFMDDGYIAKAYTPENAPEEAAAQALLWILQQKEA